MMSKGRNKCVLIFPTPLCAMVLGVLCILYVEVSHSASITVTTSEAIPTTLRPSANNATSPAPAPLSSPAANNATRSPPRITTLKARLGRPFKQNPRPEKARLDIQPGRMKASDIKACISKAFCEVNSASKVPNYAVNEEFFDLMNRIHVLSVEEADSGSTSVEYDEEEEEEDDDDDASSEEGSSERVRGYPRPPGPPPPGYRYGRGRDMKNGGNSTVAGGSVNVTSSVTTFKKAKDSKKDKVVLKKTGKKTKVSGKKTQKKLTNGTLIAIPKRRRSRIEVAQEKAQQEAYLTRKQREMGQVNDLAALIRISADIGLTLRNPRKCRTIFNKCTMSHEQIVDLFNQTLLAVTTPATMNNAPDLSHSAPDSLQTTKRVKVTLAASSPTLPSKLQLTSPYSDLPSVSAALKATMGSSSQSSSLFVTTQSPHTTTEDDLNRSSKTRHDFYDEDVDVEYMTDTEIQPVQTYALFVNDAPEESVKTAEEITVQETFKKYANAFPAEALLPGDLPSLREKNPKTKNLKPAPSSSRSTKNKNKLVGKRGKPSSEEDEEEDEEDDDAGSTSAENRSGYMRYPITGYRVEDVESGEAGSAAKESGEGPLPPLVQKEKPKVPAKVDEDEEDEEEDSDESAEADEVVVGKNRGNDKVVPKASGVKKKAVSKVKPAADEDEESSEEDDVEAVNDDHQWTPVYQMYQNEKKKGGQKKKHKGPYKGGDGPYDDSPSHGPPPTPSHSSGGMLSNAFNSLKKPWGGSSGSHEANDQSHHFHPSSHSQEVPYGDAPFHHGGHGGHGGPIPGGPPYGNGPLSASQEVGGGEQKQGLFQSIMSWFKGNKNNEQSGPHQPGAPPSFGGQPPYGGGSSEHHHHHHHHHDEQPQHETATGAPWPSQPDPAGVGHFGQSYNAYRRGNRESSEEDSVEEALLKQPIKMKQKKRRFRGRSDSIITNTPKKTTSAKKTKSNGGPPPPVVVIPKDTKSSSGSSDQYQKLIQADGGITSGSNAGKKKIVTSNKEIIRTKKAAVKPKTSQGQSSSTVSKKKQKIAEKSRRTSRESDEDDDEAYSSEEIYNQQVAKLKTGSGIDLGGSIATLGVSSSNSKSDGANNNGGSSSKNSNKSGNKQKESTSFPNYFESMFGTEEKDKYTIKGKDDGSLLFGFESLSSTINANPMELPTVPTKKKASTYKVNRNKKKQKKKGTSPPVKFNTKEVAESSEEEDKKK